MAATRVVTVLFTDIEGSTDLWQRYPETMNAAVRSHDQMVLEAVAAHGGDVFAPGGDGFGIAFESPLSGTLAAVEALGALRSHDFGVVDALRVRFGIHCGPVNERAGNYYGTTVNTTSRLLQVSYGDQIVVSQEALDLMGLLRESLPLGVSTRDLGVHHLPGIERPVHVHQILAPSLRDDFPRLRSSHARGDNLPTELTSLVGRDEESHELIDLITRHRLVTVIGPGGAGKSRLALRAARESNQFADGVWLIDVRAISDPALLRGAVSHTLRIREVDETSAEALLIDYLRERSVLLIFDECEHLIPEVAALTTEVLRSCPHLHVLATSREQLAVEGEATLRIAGLDGSVSELGDVAPAIDLFEQRAQLARSGFVVDASNIEAVAGICQRLDGLPLAIELAAARVRSFTPDEILTRLANRFALLDASSEATDHPGVLRGAVAWSFDLLSGGERGLFLMLSGFAGDFSLQRAEALGRRWGFDGASVDALLARLVDKSMVVSVPSDRRSAYRLLNTLRAFAREIIEEDGRRHRLDAAVLDTYREWLSAADLDRSGRNDVEVYEQLDAEYRNVEAALSYAERADPAGGLELAIGLWWYWYARGHWTEGATWLETFVNATESDVPITEIAQAYLALATLNDSFQTGQKAPALFEKALALQEKAGDAAGMARTLNNLAVSANLRSDSERAQNLLEEAMAASELAGGEFSSTIRINLGSLALEQDDFERADDLLDQALEQARSGDGAEVEAAAMLAKGEVQQARGNHSEAIAWFKQSLTLYGEVGTTWDVAAALEAAALSHRINEDPEAAYAHLTESIRLRMATEDWLKIAGWLQLWAGVDVDAGEYQRASRLFGAADSLHEEVQEIDRAEEGSIAQSDITRLRETYPGFHQQWAEGQLMSAVEAIDLTPVDITRD